MQSAHQTTYDTQRFPTWRTVLFCSLGVILAAQFNTSILTADFKVSAGAICLPVLIYAVKHCPILPVTLLSSAGVLLARAGVAYLADPTAPVFAQAYPEAIFYLVFGLVLFLFKSKARQSVTVMALTSLLADALSNLSEMTIRTGLDAFAPDIIMSILLVAVFRAAIVWVTLELFSRYSLRLLNREHADRYNRLTMLVSHLDSEMLWMKKSATHIEDVMTDAFSLYRDLREAAPEDGHADKALDIARNVHEIKKEYLLITSGIEDAIRDEKSASSMMFEDLFDLLDISVKREATAWGKEPNLEVSCDRTLEVRDPYRALSVFHNLMVNAVEASEKKDPTIRVEGQRVQQADGADLAIFTVTDDGPGIPPDKLDDIFQPGYSTKFDEESGSFNRGLGLCLVKEIVEDEFGGQLSVESEPGKTVFTVRIPAVEES